MTSKLLSKTTPKKKFDLVLPKREITKVSVTSDDSATNNDLNIIRYELSGFSPSKITESIWLGSYKDSSCHDELSKMGITHILNVAKECSHDNDVQNIIVKKFDIVDHSDSDIHSIFDEAHKFINECLESKGKILIHCQQGISRSTTVLISYLMKYGFVSLDDTKYEPFGSYESVSQYVRSRRSIVSPNLGFVFTLCEFEKELKKDHSGIEDDEKSSDFFEF